MNDAANNKREREKVKVKEQEKVKVKEHLRMIEAVIDDLGIVDKEIICVDANQYDCKIHLRDRALPRLGSPNAVTTGDGHWEWTFRGVRMVATCREWQPMAKVEV